MSLENIYELYAEEFIKANPDEFTRRDPSHKKTDEAAVQALVQAAVDVELFTIPLYMNAMYSIQGMHHNDRKYVLYQGRLWPGAAPTSNPQNANEQSFNLIYSVYVQKILALQIAANIANAVGKHPSFTSALLQDEQLGWICYGPDKTVIPYIIDLRDTTQYAHVKVQLSELNQESVELFLAITESASIAKELIKPDCQTRYFPTVPFKEWQPEDALPLFGTVGWLYKCLAEYLSIGYSDGTTLFEIMYQPDSAEFPQRDIFNIETNLHPRPEYPEMPTQVAPSASPEAAKQQIFTMMSAITDQSAGCTLKLKPTPAVAGEAVEGCYQPNLQNLQVVYPTYNTKGEQIPSATAHARYFSEVVDQYDRFVQIQGLLNSQQVVTWKAWLEKYSWSPECLHTEDYVNNENIPDPAVIANTLNEFGAESGSTNFNLLSMVATSTIASVTTSLNQYWSQPDVAFPYGAVAGTGDRLAIGWAVFGKAPDLSISIAKRERGALYHACQGLDFVNPSEQQCASEQAYHTCANTCKGEGGCGFTPTLNDTGNSCNSCRLSANCGFPPPAFTIPNSLFSAPAANKCAGLSGCAVPISASSLYPNGGTMALYNIQEGKAPEELAEKLTFFEGEAVYDVAWRAYTTVLKHQGKAIPEKPTPSQLRLVLTPSTT